MARFSQDDADGFVRGGFLRIDEAFPVALAEEARAILWRGTGCGPGRAGTGAGLSYVRRLWHDKRMISTRNSVRPACSKVTPRTRGDTRRHNFPGPCQPCQLRQQIGA